MTQAQLAEEVGVTQGYISEVESGRARRLSDTHRVLIAKALGVDPYELFPYPEDVSA